MDKFRISGGNALKGRISISGAKNSALPCMAAALLSAETVTLHNLPYARDIITQWVSKMVMFNIYFLDRLPFTEVCIHSMIQDGEGRKMSKSLNNGVDPLDIVQSHGADAMRFTLAHMTTQTQDVRMPVERVFLSKNADSALKLGQARGAALAAVPAALGVHEYAARAIKLAVVGTGGAEKPQVAHMVKRLLAIDLKLAADAADALAVAICHAHSRKFEHFLHGIGA